MDSPRHSAILGVIKPRLLEAVASTRHLLEDDLPVAVRELWIEAICDLLLHAHTLEGRPTAGITEANQFRRLPFHEKQQVAAQINLTLDDFVRLVRGAQVHERSSARPPPPSTRPPRTGSAVPKRSSKPAAADSGIPAKVLGWVIPGAAKVPKFGK